MRRWNFFWIFCILILLMTSLTFASNDSGDKTGGTIRKAFVMEDGIPVYVVGAGDILEITIWEGIKSKTSSVEVKANGSINVSFVDLNVNGLTVKQVESRLYEKLKKFIRKPSVDVKVKKFKSKNVNLLGAIQGQIRQPTGPGIYPLTGRITLSEMLTVAGGFAHDANLSNIQITKKDGRTQIINLFDLFLRGDLKKDIVLDDGDTVFVPRRVEVEDNFYIFGEVNRPGIYPLKGGTTLVQALGIAGGYKNSAILTDIKIIRGSLQKPDLISTNVESIIKKGALNKDTFLMNNDIIYVPKSRIGNWNSFIAKIRPTLELLILPFAGAQVVNDVIKGD